MKAADDYRKTWPNKTDDQIIESLGNEVKDKVETIGKLLYDIEILERNARPELKQTISEWQLCPMCGGEGDIDNMGTSTSVKRQCPVCNGRRILIKPVINKNIPGI